MIVLRCAWLNLPNYHTNGKKLGMEHYYYNATRLAEINRIVEQMSPKAREAFEAEWAPLESKLYRAHRIKKWLEVAVVFLIYVIVIVHYHVKLDIEMLALGAVLPIMVTEMKNDSYLEKIIPIKREIAVRHYQSQYPYYRSK